jgi:lambda family phage portal protein
MSLLNRLLLPIAPKTACRREAWIQYSRGFYSSADTSSRSAGWTTQNASGEQSNQGSRDIIRARARDLERNSDILNAEILAMERNVVGSGFVLQSKVLKGDDEDEALNTRIEQCWKKWCRPENCEITGRFSLSELACLCLRRRFVDGGFLILKVIEGGQFKLQLLEVDDLDPSVQMNGKHRVVGGIEIDEYRRPVAYFIKIYDVWGYSVESKRVPADRIIYIPNLTRPSQIREISPTAPSLGRIDDVNELIDAAVEKERVLAHLSVVVEKTGGTLTGISGIGRGYDGDSGTAPGEKDPPQEILDQGSVTYLQPGEKVSTVAPAGTSSTVDPMIKTTQRLAGGGIGLSYEAVSRDMSQVNYSSARQGLLEDQKTYRPLQKYLIEHLLDVIFPEWMDWAVLTGQLMIPDYFRDSEKFQRHVWIASGWDWVDPVKEANANKTALQTNQKTLQEICAEKGKDWRDVVRQRSAEEKMLQSLNLSESGGNTVGTDDA